MTLKMNSILFIVFIGIFLCSHIRSEDDDCFVKSRDPNSLIWCTVNTEEQKKCERMSDILQTNAIYDEYNRRDTFQLNCTKKNNKDECMVALDNNCADLTTLDPGEVFVGGRYHSLVPIIEERYTSATSRDEESRLFAVAVVKKYSEVHHLRDLRGKKACFGGVGTLAGWVIPIDKLMKLGGMERVDCNNHVKSVLEFFGPSCAVNSLSDKYNPLGDNSHKLCEICGSEIPGVRCTSNDPYSGYEGALQCVMDRGEVAFLKHSAIREYFDTLSYYSNPSFAQNTSPRYNDNGPSDFPFFGGNRGQTSTTTRRPFAFPFDNSNNNQQGFNSSSPFGSSRNVFGDEVPNPSAVIFQPRGPKSYNEFKENYELLCDDGSRRDIDDWALCNWGQIPPHAIVTSSAKPNRLRQRYQRYLQNVFRQFGERDVSSQTLNPNFKLFESIPQFGNRSNLLFQDATISFRTVPEQDQTYSKFLGEHLQTILDIRSCPVPKMVLCVTSEAEYFKCIQMRMAMNAQLLRPEMTCERAHSHINCMKLISNGTADAAILDAGDIYTAGYHYGLIPIMSEIYNTEEPEYWAVAVAYQGDADTELTYLKGKLSCHSGIGHGAGWIIPMAYLISSGRMRNYGCDSVTAASQYFSKSCVPGALSREYTFGSQHSNLCDLCRGSSYAYCSRDASEDFYGSTGAFRCLVEGGGQVAFVRHTTVSEVTDGKRREFWARNTLSGDYELLCRDGTRAPVTEYRRCNLGKVKANAVVVRGGSNYDDSKTKAIINLFLYAQQFYGKKDQDDFNFAMFYSPPPYSDLIFQDSAQQLRIIPQEERNYRTYLGAKFLKARALVDCRASAPTIHDNFSVLVALTLSTVWLYRLQ